MRNLRRFASICVLLVSFSAVAFGGDIQGPNMVTPLPPDNTVESTSTSDLSTETELAILVSWLVSSIF